MGHTEKKKRPLSQRPPPFKLRERNIQFIDLPNIE